MNEPASPEAPFSTGQIVAQVRELGWKPLALRLGLVALIVGGLLVAFAYAGGWLSPHQLTPTAFVNQLENAAGGPHAGFRRNHAKGVCFQGHFDANGAGVRLSRAAVFAAGSRTPVVGRFALAGQQPYAQDDAHTVRSLAVEFDLATGELWRTGINDIPVFPVRTPDGFYDLGNASAPDPATGKPDPAKMAAFQAKHPESVAALKQIGGRPVSSGFDNDTFWSLNAFEFIAADGTVTPVRWTMVPLQPFVAAPTTVPLATADKTNNADKKGKTDPADKNDKNSLFDALITAVHAHPLQWRLVITVGKPGDAVADASIAWPTDREQVDVGTLTVEGTESEETSRVRDLTFDPLVLPDGIRGSADPLLSARSAAYAVSLRRREGEPKQPSAVTPEEVRK